MKVAYIFEQDAGTPDVQSGRPASILNEFEHAGWTVHRCFPLRAPDAPTLVSRIKRRYARLTGKQYFKGRSKRHLLEMARQAQAMLSRVTYDFIFCPGTLPISYLHTKKPLAISSDTTLHGMANYYPEMSRLAAFQLRAFERAERMALRKPQLLVYASDWAAQSAISHYGVPAERVAVIPSGANFGTENTAAQVEGFLSRRRTNGLDLLFVGKDWARKGGDLCVETVRRLNQLGTAAVLHVVGCSPAIAAEMQPFVQVHGLLRPSQPHERARLEELFRSSHFLFTPSRAEAYGMVFCDANAFGLPCITTATGGIPTIVRNGVNGAILPLEAVAADYAREILALAPRAIYTALTRSSFKEFEHRLNWRAWMRSFQPQIEAALDRERKIAAQPAI